MKTRKSNILGKQVMVEGMMAFGKLETGQRTLDFECCTTQKQTAVSRRQQFTLAR